MPNQTFHLIRSLIYSNEVLTKSEHALSISSQRSLSISIFLCFKEVQKMNMDLTTHNNQICLATLD